MISMHTQAAQLIIIKSLNQPTFPSADKWIKKKYVLYTQWRTALPKGWMYLEAVMLSEINQIHKLILLCFSYIRSTIYK